MYAIRNELIVDGLSRGVHLLKLAALANRLDGIEELVKVGRL